jgi:hypothetical protein
VGRGTKLKLKDDLLERLVVRAVKSASGDIATPLELERRRRSDRPVRRVRPTLR